MHTKTTQLITKHSADTKLLGRRQFLIASAIGLGLSALPTYSAMLSSPPKAVGVQLYTLRDWMAVSVPATLQMVAAVGYKEVEFAGFYDQNASQIQQLLLQNGLRSPASHIMLKALDNDLNKVIDESLAVGNKYIVMPYLLDEERGTHIDDYKALAEKLNRYGERIRKAGMQLAYHNHEFEFEKRQNQLPFDILLDETDVANMAFELDLYWTAKAGYDPLDYFKRNPGRFKLWHVKDMDSAGNFADVGTGTIDFKRIFAQAKRAGLEHAFVERDNTGDKMLTLQIGYKNTYDLLSGNS